MHHSLKMSSGHRSQFCIVFCFFIGHKPNFFNDRKIKVNLVIMSEKVDW